MKRIISLLMCLAMLCTCAMAETFEGVGAGFGGEIKVAATVEGGKLTAVEVLSHTETPGISDPAFAKIPAAIIENQSVAVDTVAGCTFSSKGLIEAVTAAWVASGANLEDISKEIVVDTTTKDLETKTADVVIIGAGGAGLSAAVEVLRAGGSVLVVDKMATAGGNTAAAGSALNAAGTDIQKAGTIAATGIDAIKDMLSREPKDDNMKRWQENVSKELDAYLATGSTHVFDSVDLHKLQTYVDGDYVGKSELIEVLGDNAPKAIEFLSELGTQWKPEITAAVGATWQRSHQPTGSFGGLGNDFVMPQYNFVVENGGEVVVERKAEELIVEDGRVVGVKGTGSDGTPFEYRANKSVIMATGGFAANVEMRQAYNKHWANLDESVPTSNLPCATGDGIGMATAIGANVIGMEWIQLVPGCVVNMSASISNLIFVNAEGNRFVREDDRRDVLSGAILSQTGSYFWGVQDAHNVWDIQKGVAANKKTVEELVAGGGLIEAATVEELAEKIGVDPTNLKNSMETYNKAVAGTEADALGRKLFEYPLDKGPYYASKGYAKVHHTMGGIEINANCEVLDTNGNVIPGFYAAGEVTGGIHGSNRLGGNAIADVVVFGRLAGQNAMK